METSRDDDGGWLLLLVVGAVALLKGKRRPAVTSSMPAAAAESDPGRPIELNETPEGRVAVDMMTSNLSDWVWPVPSIFLPNGDVIHPTVSSGFRIPSRPGHDGQDIMYPRQPLGPMPARKGDGGGRTVFAPGPGNPVPFDKPPPVLAARAGRIWSVKKGDKGWFILIDHERTGYTSSYLHMESVTFPPHRGGKLADGSPGMLVEAGEQLGIMGASPEDAEKVRHVHFQTMKGGGDNRHAVDPKSLNQAKWGRKIWRI